MKTETIYERAYHHSSLKDKSFLITGGSGFIGSNIVEYLLVHGAKKVRVLDNLANGYKENIIPFLNLIILKYLSASSDSSSIKFHILQN